MGGPEDIEKVARFVHCDGGSLDFIGFGEWEGLGGLADADDIRGRPAIGAGKRAGGMADADVDFRKTVAVGRAGRVVDDIARTGVGVKLGCFGRVTAARAGMARRGEDRAGAGDGMDGGERRVERSSEGDGGTGREEERSIVGVRTELVDDELRDAEEAIDRMDGLAVRRALLSELDRTGGLRKGALISPIGAATSSASGCSMPSKAGKRRISKQPRRPKQEAHTDF